jgi:large subunit ribosomal protein L25
MQRAPRNGQLAELAPEESAFVFGEFTYFTYVKNCDAACEGPWRRGDGGDGGIPICSCKRAASAQNDWLHSRRNERIHLLRKSSMAQQLDVLNVTVRKPHGKRDARRLRRGGSVPAILYGHGEANVPLAVPGEQLESILRHGHRVVDLEGAVTETARIRELQWDTWGLHVLHVDLVRASKDEIVEERVAVVLRGEAPGVKEGGIVKHLLHDMRIRCSVSAMPEKIECNINHLGLNGMLKVSDLVPPEGVQLLNDPEQIVVQVVLPAAEAEEAAVPTEGAEPELIGRKPTEAEEEEG